MWMRVLAGAYACPVGLVSVHVDPVAMSLSAVVQAAVLAAVAMY
jgi:hypothetical protein